MDAVKLDELKQRAARATEIADHILMLRASANRDPPVWLFAGEEVIPHSDMRTIVWRGRQQLVDGLERELSQLLGEKPLTPGEDEEV